MILSAINLFFSNPFALQKISKKNWDMYIVGDVKEDTMQVVKKANKLQTKKLD